MQSHVIACLVVWCSLVSVSHSVIQYKMRGPPGPQRLTHSHPPHYTKSKWPMPPRPPTRPHGHVRPIPVHMASYKVPVIARPPKIPQAQPAPLIFPSAVWKTPTAVYRPPVEKPFLTSPPITQQYEYHLNKEPIANIPMIKQIGEKGPIHTIPAPNLGPADKPNLILEEPPQKHTYQYTKEPEISPNAISSAHSNVFASNSLLGAQALPLIQQHQYQVTENAEPADQLVHPQNPFTAQKNYYAPDPDPNNLLQKLTQYTDMGSLNNFKLFPQDTHIYAAPQQLHAHSSQATNLPLSSQELYHLLNGIPQQQLMDGYGMSAMQQPLQQHYIQQHQSLPSQNYQALLNSPQLAQPEPAYYNQIQDTVSQQIKDNFKPQFHTFNYEEQSSQPNNSPRKEFVQSRVTADYSIEPDVAETYQKPSIQSPHEALAQTQYIQQYFATREDNNVSDNELGPEQEGSTKASQILNQLSAKNEISPSMFYSSLPNREAAETLATLQAAGSINSNILKLKQQKPEENTNSNHRDSMRIFVPDEEDNYEDMESQASGENVDTSKSENSHSQGIRIYETTHVKNANSRRDDSIEYDDYSSEENSSSSETDKLQDSTEFGNKIKSKNSR